MRVRIARWGAKSLGRAMHYTCDVQVSRDGDGAHSISLLPLVRTNDIRIHAREVIVDVVLLGVGIALGAC